MGRYRHLSIEEREEIMCLRREGAGVGDIARAIRRDKSTVSRELRRNAYRDAGLRPRYRAPTAQRRYEARRARCRRPRLLDDPGLRFLVQRKILEDHWSPEQVAGRVAFEEGGRRVSASTIYRAINDRRLDTPRMRVKDEVFDLMCLADPLVAELSAESVCEDPEIPDDDSCFGQPGKAERKLVARFELFFSTQLSKRDADLLKLFRQLLFREELFQRQSFPFPDRLSLIPHSIE